MPARCCLAQVGSYSNSFLLVRSIIRSLVVGTRIKTPVPFHKFIGTPYAFPFGRWSPSLSFYCCLTGLLLSGPLTAISANYTAYYFIFITLYQSESSSAFPFLADCAFLYNAHSRVGEVFPSGCYPLFPRPCPVLPPILEALSAGGISPCISTKGP